MIGVGISTYNDFANTNRLINTIKTLTQGIYGEDYKLVIVDDGTQEDKIVSALHRVCDAHDVELSINEENRGIPYTWNRITELCDTDIVVILNNDILVTDQTWLKCIEYFLTNNDKIGTVGFPLIYPQDDKRERNWGDKPGHVGAAVGCCFGFLKKCWEKVKNPDSSIGFWEDLISFHEETFFGFRLSELGYYNFMLTYPPMVHFGGQTFDRNKNLWKRPIDWSTHPELNKQEYIDTIIKSKVYPEEWKKDKIVWAEDGVEYVDRMAFSRYMFAKYWDVLDTYDEPQVPVHKKVVDPMPRRVVKWLDAAGDVQEGEV